MFKPLQEALRRQGIQHIHFIGVGGAGMCGLAELMKRLGFTISGSDQQASAVLIRLNQLGIRTFSSHAAEHIQGAQLIVVSRAIPSHNPEIMAAQTLGIPLIPRGQFLGDLMRYHQGISIAGSHGKTTTSALLAHVLLKADLQPSFCIGGQLISLGTNAKLGNGPYFVAEADESDASMLFQNPSYAILTNLDADHMDTYQHHLSKLYQAFEALAEKIPCYGRLFIGIDDPKLRELFQTYSHKPYASFGLSEDAHYRASQIRLQEWSSRFQVSSPQHDPFELHLKLPGEHNIRNALAAIAVALHLEVSPEVIQAALPEFQGVARRTQLCGYYAVAQDLIPVIDDYGHHPAEITETLKALKTAFPKRRLVLAYQLHRYTRTRDLWTDFIHALSAADQLILLDIYPASETPIPGITAQSLHQEIPNSLYAPTSEQTLQLIQEKLKANDLLVIMGAGDISQLRVQLTLVPDLA